MTEIRDICQRCGAKVSPGYDFCLSCGMKFSELPPITKTRGNKNRDPKPEAKKIVFHNLSMSQNRYGIISLTIGLIGLLIVIPLLIYLFIFYQYSESDIFTDLRALYAMPFAIAGIIFGIVGTRVDHNSTIAGDGLKLGIVLFVLSILPQLLIFIVALLFSVSGGW